MDGSKWYYAKLKKADIERQIPFDLTMWPLKQTNKQNKMKTSIAIENEQIGGCQRGRVLERSGRYSRLISTSFQLYNK